MMDANSSTTLDPAIDTFLQQTNLDDIMAAYLPDHPTLTNQPGVLTVTALASYLLAPTPNPEVANHWNVGITLGSCKEKLLVGEHSQL
jgi:hypothetical protein